MSQKMFPVAILAGGVATRLQPLTQNIPKALIDVNGEPFIAHQLRLLQANCIEQVIVCAGYLGEMIQEYVGNGGRFGLQVGFSYDGPQLLGTAGAIKRALPLLGESFFVLYGDTYLLCDYGAVQREFEKSNKQALMTVFRNENRWDRSNVELADGRILAYDKQNQTPRMHHIDYGLGVFNRDAFEIVPDDQPYDLAMLYQNLLDQAELAAYEVSERFYEIGTFGGLEEMRHYTLHCGAIPTSERRKYMNFIQQYLSEASQIIPTLDQESITRAVELLAETRSRGGRLFILGVGGSAANASHAVNDFRKLVGLEAYAPTDNVSELTARTNDEGWATIFKAWLEGSRLNKRDTILVFSVGGGNLEKNVSPNLVMALQFAKEVGAKVIGIVGRDGGYTARVADACVIIPTVHPDHVTPHTEAFQSVIHHLLVTHPKLKIAQTKWESVK